MLAKRKKIALLVAGLFMLLAFLYLAWSSAPVDNQASQEYLPPEISGFKLETDLEGDSAFRTVRKMHLGQLDMAEGVIIGYYQEGITIWIAQYASEDSSSSETQRMKEAIADYARDFSTPLKLRLGEQPVYETKLKGASHYFWNKGKSIFYIVPGPLDTSEIEDLVEELNRRSGYHSSE